jgi:hypothetical protein
MLIPKKCPKYILMSIILKINTIFNLKLIKPLFLFNSTNLINHKDYQALVNCSDVAYEPDCKNKASAGLCDVNLADKTTLRHYCQKSCGMCSNKIHSHLSCNSLVSSCNGGSCLETNYFGIASIRCNCGVLTGSYCQRGK